MIYIGIDPGASGAIAWIVDGQAYTHTLQGRDPADTWHELLSLSLSPDHVAVAVLERVHSMPRQGVASTFKFGASFGMLHGFLVAAGIPYELVTPQAWQAALKCRTGGDKNITKAAASRLYPEKRVTHATADALLLAEYCRRLDWRHGGCGQ